MSSINLARACLDHLSTGPQQLRHKQIEALTPLGLQRHHPSTVQQRLQCLHGLGWLLISRRKQRFFAEAFAPQRKFLSLCRCRFIFFRCGDQLVKMPGHQLTVPVQGCEIIFPAVITHD